MLFHTLFAILDLKISNITSISIVTSKCALNLEKRWRNSLRRRRLLKINQKQKKPTSSNHQSDNEEACVRAEFAL